MINGVDYTLVLGIMFLISLPPAFVGLLAVFGADQYKWADKWTGKMIAWAVLPCLFIFAFIMLFADSAGGGSGGDEWFCNEVNGEKKCYRQKDIDGMVP